MVIPFPTSIALIAIVIVFGIITGIILFKLAVLRRHSRDTYLRLNSLTNSVDTLNIIARQLTREDSISGSDSSISRLRRDIDLLRTQLNDLVHVQTYLAENRVPEVPVTPTPTRRRTRTNTNNSNSNSELLSDYGSEIEPPRRRGRPAGSRNRTPLEREYLERSR